VPPSEVEQLEAEPGPDSTSFAWTVPDEADVRRVVIRYRTDGTFPETPADGMPLYAGNASPGADGEFEHTGLAFGTTYAYSVFVIDASGNASEPETVAASPLGVPPGPVQNLRRTDVQ
jgi:hypothetical protein